MKLKIKMLKNLISVLCAATMTTSSAVVSVSANGKNHPQNERGDVYIDYKDKKCYKIIERNNERIHIPDENIDWGSVDNNSNNNSNSFVYKKNKSIGAFNVKSKNNNNNNNEFDSDDEWDLFVENLWTNLIS